MAKLTQNGKQWETPQIVPNQSATEFYGGTAPDMTDVIKSANARGQTRHEMKGGHLADADVLPDSAEMLGNEMVGIMDSGYLAKKNLEFGVNALYNSLPPGMDIEDQENCDIRQMTMRTYEGGLSFPGDGWSKRTRGEQMPMKKDMGRPGMTNYKQNGSLNPKNPK